MAGRCSAKLLVEKLGGWMHTRIATASTVMSHLQIKKTNPCRRSDNPHSHADPSHPEVSSTKVVTSGSAVLCVVLVSLARRREVPQEFAVA